MTMIQFILPLVTIILFSIPLWKVFNGKVTKESAKTRLIIHVCGFFGTLAAVLLIQIMSNDISAQTEVAQTSAIVGTIAQGMGFLAAGLSTGLSALGAGIAVASSASAAIGAFSENEKNFGKSLIFVALGEGVAIYGILISILIISSM